jgi:hypothetical protein
LRCSPFYRPGALRCVLRLLLTKGEESPISGMRAAALHHTKIVRELVVLWAAVSSAAGLVLGRSPTETSRVEVMSEMVAKF